VASDISTEKEEVETPPDLESKRTSPQRRRRDHQQGKGAKLL